MPRRLTATQVKTHLLSLLDDVAAGEEVEIVRHGQTVARLVPAGSARALRGALAGTAVTEADEELLFTTDAAWDLS